MAAVIELRTGRALADERRTPPSAPAGPRLRVIHGGRSETARRLRRTFLLRRLAVAVAALAVVWLAAQVVGAAFSPIGATGAAPAPLGEVYRVQPGDTLWALATQVDPGADPRDVVDRIVEMNEQSAAVAPSGELRAGEQLRLPVAD